MCLFARRPDDATSWYNCTPSTIVQPPVGCPCAYTCFKSSYFPGRAVGRLVWSCVTVILTWQHSRIVLHIYISVMQACVCPVTHSTTVTMRSRLTIASLLLQLGVSPTFSAEARCIPSQSILVVVRPQLQLHLLIRGGSDVTSDDPYSVGNELPTLDQESFQDRIDAWKRYQQVRCCCRVTSGLDQQQQLLHS